MSGLDPTERFSDRADTYVRGRPTYPDAVVTHLEQAGAAHLRNRLIRNAALAPALARARGKRRDHRARARNDLGRRGGWFHRKPDAYSAAVSALRAFASSRAITASVDMTSPKVR